MHTIHRVAEFHELMGHPIASKVGELLTPEQRELRVRMIAEELLELCEAWGVGLDVRFDPQGYETTTLHAYVDRNIGVDHVGAADALADLDYVVQGSNLVAGYPAEACGKEVHRSNMTKLWEDGKPRSRGDGKILKPPTYTPPDLAAVLAAHPAVPPLAYVTSPDGLDLSVTDFKLIITAGAFNPEDG